MANPALIVVGGLLAALGLTMMLTSLLPPLRRFRIWAIWGAWTPPLAGTLYGVWFFTWGLAFMLDSDSLVRSVLMPFGIGAAIMAVVLDRRAKKKRNIS